MLKKITLILLASFLMFGFINPTVKPNQDLTDVFDGYPVPTDKNMLFYIQKNFNTNTVVYTANIGKDGKLDPKEPVKVFWRRYQEDGRIRELKFIEKAFGFGMNTKPAKGKDNTYIFSLVSIKELKFVITQNKKGQVRLATMIDGKAAKIKRVFVTAEHTKVIPKIFSVEVFGSDLKTGEFLYQKIKNND